jgi:hypothetical protein
MADEKKNDIRLEAAIAKLWTTEMGWQIIDDCLQVRGGRGYETARLAARPRRAADPRRAHHARLPHQPHLRGLLGDHAALHRARGRRHAPAGGRRPAAHRPHAVAEGRAFAKIGAHYAVWFPQRVVGWGSWPKYREFGELATHLRYIERTSRKLARSLFYAMARFGPKLQYKQAVLGRWSTSAPSCSRCPPPSCARTRCATPPAAARSCAWPTSSASAAGAASRTSSTSSSPTPTTRRTSSRSRWSGRARVPGKGDRQRLRPDPRARHHPGRRRPAAPHQGRPQALRHPRGHADRGGRVSARCARG